MGRPLRTRTRTKTGGFATLVVGVVALLGGVLVATAGPAQAATLKEVTDFGTNPTQLQMYVYEPYTLLDNPPVVVAVHYCHGNARVSTTGASSRRSPNSTVSSSSIPPSPRPARLFRRPSDAALTHDGGATRRASCRWSSTPSRTQRRPPPGLRHRGLLRGDDDECLAGRLSRRVRRRIGLCRRALRLFRQQPRLLGWNSECATGTVTHTAQEWGDLVRAAYPGYTGARPRIQLWHGTADKTLNYVNFGEEIKQWTNVLGVSQTPASTETDTPAVSQTRTRYGSSGEDAAVEAISLAGVSHNLPVDAAAAIAFFGLDNALQGLGHHRRCGNLLGCCQYGQPLVQWVRGLTP